MVVDDTFEDYFKGKLKQVFLYITNKCNLHCQYCLYKTNLSGKEMNYDTACTLLKLFYDYGAKKITLIGGEPTLYDDENDNNRLFNIIEYALNLGYEYIRLDTNGQFNSDLLFNETFQKIDDLAFSLDSNIPEINDKYRGSGSFYKCITNIRIASELGYKITTTSCIHEDNIQFMDEMIDFFQGLNIKTVNFHPLLKMGIARDNFSGDSHIELNQWLDVYHKYVKKEVINDDIFQIRIPQRFVPQSDYESWSENYNYCPVRLAERILIHPDGKLRICALTIGDNYFIGKYSSNNITFNSNMKTNEVNSKRILKTPCMSQNIKFKNFLPLCISYKPDQYEYVWNNENFNKTYGKCK